MADMKRVRRPSRRKELSQEDKILHANIACLAGVKSDLAQLRSEETEIGKEIVDDMQRRGLTKIEVFSSEGMIGATLVESSTVSVDYQRLAKKVGVKVWNKVTSRTVDDAKLQAAIKSGDVDPNAIAEVSTVNPRKPFVKITKK